MPLLKHAYNSTPFRAAISTVLLLNCATDVFSYLTNGGKKTKTKIPSKSFVACAFDEIIIFGEMWLTHLKSEIS